MKKYIVLLFTCLLVFPIIARYHKNISNSDMFGQLKRRYPRKYNASQRAIPVQDDFGFPCQSMNSIKAHKV